MKNGHYITEISSEKKTFDFKFGEIWKYRELIFIFAKKDLIVRYKQTIFGMCWLFITPILSVIPYWFLFGEIAELSTDGIPHILFYMTGTNLWGFFSGIFIRTSTVFTSNSGLFGKVYFPRLTVALSYGASSTIVLLIKFASLIPFLFYYCFKGNVFPHFELIILLPFIILELLFMATGIGIVFSSLTTKYKDLGVVSGFIVNACMYITPIVYPLSQISSPFMRKLVLFNPLTMPIEIFRFILLGNGTIIIPDIIWSCFFTLAVCAGGILLFNSVERTFMDTV